MEREADVIVVGAGLAGLTDAGRRVMVVDQEAER